MQRDKVFKINLLQDEGIRNLYQKRLQESLLMIPTSWDVDNGGVRLTKSAVQKAAAEALGKRAKTRGKRRLRIWNPDIEETIRQKKQQSYLSYLQKKNSRG